MNKWQPIETAPQNEEVLTLVVQASVPIVRNAYWNDGEMWECQQFESRDGLTGWWSPTSSCGSEKLVGIFAPTHWAPLPAAPAAPPR